MSESRHDPSELSTAKEVLAYFGLRAPPVDVTWIAQQCGIEVYEAEKLEWVGALDVGAGGEPTRIFTRASDSLERQRFAIAHELGHYFLHRHLQTAFRDAPGQISPEDIEANIFAAELLMPKYWVKAHRRYGSIPELAAVFGVSKQAMEIRFQALGF